MNDLPDSQLKPLKQFDNLQQKIDELEERLERFGRIEQALKESEDRHQSVVDNVEIGIAVISPAMEILSLNNQMGKWFPSVDASVKPICYKSFNNPPRESICPYCPTDKTLRDGKVHRSIARIPSNGKARHFKIIASPLKNKSDQVVAAIEMLDDITRKRRSETLLRKERKIFLSVLQKSPYGTVILDKKGMYLYINDEFTKITGYTLVDVPDGISWFLKAYPDPKRRKAILRAWKEDISEKGIPRTFTVRCKNGEEKDIEFRSTSLDDDRYLTMLSDVSEQKRAEKELKRALDELELRVAERTDELVRLNRDLEEHIDQLKAANAELETFSYSISHDLKTPVIAVEGFSRILFEKYSDQLDGKGKKILSMISGSALQMRELIDDLLAFFTLGRKKLTLSTIDLGKIVNEIFDQLRAVHQGRAIQLSINPSPAVSADKTMIRQIVLNLLSNAIKYSRAKMITAIEFGGWIEAGNTVYYIKDNGIGFPMEQVGRLFEVFERLHQPDEFEGTGIGLATVKRIVQRHGGEVWAQSKVNEGATFYFSIPIVS